MPYSDTKENGLKRKVTVLSRNAFAINGSTLLVADFCNCLAKFGFDVTLVSLTQPDFCFKKTTNLLEVNWRIPGYIQVGQYLFTLNYRKWIYFLRLIISTQITNRFRFLRFLRNCRDRVAKRFGHKDDMMLENDNDFYTVFSERECSWVSKTIRDIAPHYIVFDFINTIPLLTSFQDSVNAVKICLAHDIFHRRASSAICNVSVSPLYSKEEEIAYFNKMDAVLTIQDEEASYLKSCNITAAVFSIPFSIMAFSNNVANTRQPVRHQILFIGNGSDHNVAGLKWFIQNIFPLLREKASDYKLICCGSVCDMIDKSQLIPGVYLYGVCDDISKYYMQASCSIVPLLFGSGLKTKLMESLANNCPVVSTSIGVQGIQHPEQYGIAVANHPQEFAEAIHLSAEKKELTQVEKAAFELDFSPEKIYRPLVSYMQNLI